MDESTIRGLCENELWLAEVDKRCLSSFPDFSVHFIRAYLSTSTASASGHKHRQSLRLPTSLNTSDSGAFVGPGWEDLPRSLPILGKEDKQSFLRVLLNELNFKFALKLDVCTIQTYTVRSPLTSQPKTSPVLSWLAAVTL